jgi:hypothetical protein
MCGRWLTSGPSLNIALNFVQCRSWCDTKEMDEMTNKPYGRLLLMAGLSFVAMYILMYAMVDRFANVYPNFNQFYMAGLMAAPMVMIELVLMRDMYPNKKVNALIAVTSLAALAIF